MIYKLRTFENINIKKKQIKIGEKIMLKWRKTASVAKILAEKKVIKNRLRDKVDLCGIIYKKCEEIVWKAQRETDLVEKSKIKKKDLH